LEKRCKTLKAGFAEAGECYDLGDRG